MSNEKETPKVAKDAPEVSAAEDSVKEAREKDGPVVVELRKGVKVRHN